MTACTIVIPCYNQTQYLEECLQSVIAQTVADWEVIVVDDSSTFGDIAFVLNKVANSRVKLIRHPVNKGLGAARNTGFRIGNSDRFLPLDCDDRLATNYLECLIPLLERDEEIDCVFPDFQLFGEKEGIIRYEVRDIPALLHQQWLPGPGTMMRKSLFDRVGGYCEDTIILGNEDWDFWLSAAVSGFKAVHFPEPIYYYRQHEASLTPRMRYFDYQYRLKMYANNRNLFDRYQLGSYFISDGFLKQRGLILRVGKILKQYHWHSGQLCYLSSVINRFAFFCWHSCQSL